MKCSALNVDFNGVGLDPLGSRSPPYECIKFGYPLQDARFLLLSSNLARERLQIDTDLLRILQALLSAYKLFRGTNVQHRWPWTTLNPKNMVFKWIFHCFRLWRTLRVSLKYTGDRPRQPACKIKLMLSRVPWALAQISCYYIVLYCIVYTFLILSQSRLLAAAL